MIPAWMDDAECAELPPEWFFPGPGQKDLVTLAKAACRACTVTAQCLAYATAHEAAGYRSGVWGGLTDKERSSAARELVGA